jgi:hypothetical protein
MKEMNDGADGQVMGESYCLKKSVEAKNVDSMSEAMGYHNMSDLANTKPYPVNMPKPHMNKQLGPKAADEDYNYNADR